MSKKLTLLAKSALAIPGMIATVQAAGPAGSEASYRYTYYTEDDSPEARDDSGGAQDRYKIQVHQFHILSPVADKFAVNVEASYESMSGASPVYSYIADGQEDVYTHFNGASKERRYDVSANGRYYGSTSDAGAGIYASMERDYFALNGSLDGSIQINDQMTTLSGGVSAGHDWLNPNSGVVSDSGDVLMVNDLSSEELEQLAADAPARHAAKGKTKWQLSVFEGVGQIIDMNTVVQGSVSFTYKTGYLSDPYRDCVGSDAPLADNVPCDIRPSTRAAGTLSLGVRRYLPNLNAAAHADYRLFVDNWDVMSHTLDLDYYQNWAPKWNFFVNNDVNFQLVPGIRYYQQSQAYFYEIPDLNTTTGSAYSADTTRYYSSDPRLSHYGALSLKTRLKVDFRQFSLNGSVERYAANPAYGFNFDDDTPGLPAYWRFTTGLDFRF
ncbi:MAG: DUF3570 domain-containing protein [Reinekea sp.]|nr:DUF3570 domain-containing protein [Reinekea sp.]